MAAQHSDAVTAAIADRRRLVNEALPDDVPIVFPERLYEASRYLLDAGGKRLRPTMVLLAGEAIADVDPLSEDYREFPLAGGIDLMAAAVSIEIVQTFTLIHDDIMDDDEMRRGVPAVHEEFDLETAILAGDTLYSKAFENLLETGAAAEHSVRALSELAATCTEICEGQTIDIGFEDQDAITEAEYLEMVERKTAVLYGASAAMPALLAGADDYVDPLYNFGIDVGKAFQIQDDLLDLTASTETLGKRRGSDLAENKQTIVTVHARQQGVDVTDLVPDDDISAIDEATVEEAIERLEAVGSIDYARDLAHDHVASGRDHLQALPDNEARDRLGDIAEYFVEREY
ncbi:polyprenyl synthetase family protein [Halococcoides cellulosivorans]|uniref:Phosphoesterase n=1 Tax=Halococcoides cellulosivorans TaxID=1679096 RepID=A0A2R4X0T8_9EURY|nr:polyprenyl synthetase family protein [Halococcoides cellulosivorans]AWB27414.1 phosphoesterase [Halococcoides cellulosivorans]